MTTRFLQHLADEATEIREAGLHKSERILASPQDAVITLSDGSTAINLCANNYLGLANNSVLTEAAKTAIDEHGYGMASVRFICGTQTVHKELEAKVSRFVSKEDTILYSSCWDANGGLFETILGPDDAIVSDSLNHASIIDGVIPYRRPLFCCSARKSCAMNCFCHYHDNMEYLNFFLNNKNII